LGRYPGSCVTRGGMAVAVTDTRVHGLGRCRKRITDHRLYNTTACWFFNRTGQMKNISFMTVKTPFC
jgi:hypothetical protein